MTEYEMSYLHNELMNSYWGMNMNLMSVVSAALVGSYVAAHRLSITMISITAVIFSGFMFNMATYLMRLSDSIAHLRLQIQASVDNGTGPSWYSQAVQMTPTPIQYVPASNAVVLLVIYIGVVLFFFHCRQVNRKAATAVNLPPLADGK